MLILDDPDTWPKDITQQLNSPSVLKLIRRNKHIDNLCCEPDIIDICADVDTYARSEGIAGYHCTKQLPERPFQQTGLRILDVEAHKTDVLATLSVHPSVDHPLYERIEKVLQGYWGNEKQYREGQLWFCFTRNRVCDLGGTEKFFKYYGGEAIYMPFYNSHPDVMRALEQIGEPVVIEARLDPTNLNVQKYYFGHTLICHHAQTINREFHISPCDGYARTNVAPNDIIRVYSTAEFLHMFGQ